MAGGEDKEVKVSNVENWRTWAESWDLQRQFGFLNEIQRKTRYEIWDIENNIILTFCSIFEVGQRCIPMSEDRDFQGMNKLKLSI